MKPICALVATAACLLCTSMAIASADRAPSIRPGTFAAASARFAKRLTPEQRDEWRFLKEAAASARFETEAARMALSKSSDTNVRTLAASLVNQQQAAQATLHQMLRVRNMAPPMLANDQRKVLNRLARLRGAAFDREWMAAIALRSQQDDIQAFEKAVSTLRDSPVRGWVARTLPTLRWQLASAERVVAGATRFAKLAAEVKLSPYVTSSDIKSSTAVMGAGPNPGDLSEGNMLLGPARPVDVKLTERNTR
jgi:predicted outer membrane protein